MDSPPTRTAEPSVRSEGLREIRVATERIAARQQALRAELREMQAFLKRQGLLPRGAPSVGGAVSPAAAGTDARSGQCGPTGRIAGATSMQPITMSRSSF